MIFKTTPSVGGLSFFCFYFLCMVDSEHNSITSICLVPKYFGVDAFILWMVAKQRQRPWAAGCLVAGRDPAIVHLLQSPSCGVRTQVYICQ